MGVQGLRAGVGTHLPADRCPNMPRSFEVPHAKVPIAQACHGVWQGFAIGMPSPPLHLCNCAGDEIISQQLAFGERAYWEGVVALIGLTLALNLLGYIILRR
jgi:hypothetical protein